MKFMISTTHTRVQTIGRTLLAASALAVCVLASKPAAAVTITLYPVGGPPINITAGPDGNMWYTRDTFPTGGIGKITPAGISTEYDIPTPESAPFGITAGPDGKIWFTEYADQIGTVTTGGAFTEYPLDTAPACALDTLDCTLPTAITTGPDGRLWFTTEVNTIGRINTGGGIKEFPVPTATTRGAGITKGPDGNLWFTENSGNNIGRITTGGAVTEFPVPTGSSQPSHITRGPDDNLWFTEVDGNKIGKITPGGAITEYVVPTAGSKPDGITVGPDGNLWFTERQANKIGMITTAGVITEYPTAGMGPRDIALGADGNLWFTAFGSSQIGKLDVRGVTSGGANIEVPVNTTILNTKTGIEQTVDVDVTFANVISPGITTLIATSTPTDVPPPDFTSDIGVCSKAKKLGCETDDDCASGQTCVGYHGVAFDLTTTAVVSGPITVCSHYADNEKRGRGNGYVDGTGKPGLPEQSLRLLHKEGGVFVDITLPGYPDKLNNVVCGQVSSLAAADATAARAARAVATGAFTLDVKTDMPGGKKLEDDCMTEWRVGDPKAGNPTLPKKKKGVYSRPDAQLTCKVGSKKCQADPGYCKFSFRICLNLTEQDRFQCTPMDVKELRLTEPQLADPPDDPDSINAQRILLALGTLSASNASPGIPVVTFNSAVTSSMCTANIDVTVVAGAIKSIKLNAYDSSTSNPRADSNTLNLQCTP